MAYYADLTPYEYWPEEIGTGLQNVGWLDREHPYPQGPVPDEFVARLWELCRYPLMVTRGWHECEFCDPPVKELLWVERDGERALLGTAEIRVLGHAWTTYAAPTLIYHYVTAHAYQPPAAFVTAVLLGPWPGSPAYEAAVKHRGWE